MYPFRPHTGCRVQYAHNFLYWIFCVLGTVFLLHSQAVHASTHVSTPVLTVSSPVATAGYYQLNWSLDQETNSSPTEFELQESFTQNFQHYSTILRSPDLATFISGQPNGVRYYRVRALIDSQSHTPWSKPVRVEIEHHSLLKAFLFFFVGAVVFSGVIATIYTGTRKTTID